MARIDEIGPDLYRICIYVPEIDLQFNHFLVRDDAPRTLAVMHGSSYAGDGGKALCGPAGLLREAFHVTG